MTDAIKYINLHLRRIVVDETASEREIYSRIQELWKGNDMLIRYCFPYSGNTQFATRDLPVDENGMVIPGPAQETALKSCRNVSDWEWREM